MEFQIPRIVSEEGDNHRGVFAIEPLDRGFGYTFGNSLRRVLLSSLEGAAGDLQYYRFSVQYKNCRHSNLCECNQRGRIYF